MNGDEEFIPTRESLLSRLKDWQDDDSWKEFFDTYWRLIFSAGIKAGLRQAEAQDAVQETVISVMKSMPGFQYRPVDGSFKSWLLRLTKWRIADQFRRRQKGLVEPAEHGEASKEVLESIPDPSVRALEAMWDEEWESTLVNAAMHRVKRTVDSKQYQIFDLYAVKGWPVRKVAAVLKVSVGSIYLAKHRVGTQFKKHLAELQTKPV
jgi:RNA polymerase sigma factor (sigma-70 family)